MRKKVLKLFLIILSASISISGFSQVRTNNRSFKGTIIDSLRISGIITGSSQEKPEIILTKEQAVKFLQQKFQPHYWKDIRDPFRLAIGQLVYEASHAPIDSSAIFLKRFPYDSISIPWDKFYIWEPLRLKIPVIIPPEHPIPVDTTAITDSGKIAVIAKPPLSSQSVARLKDTTILVIIDTLDEVHSEYSKFPFTSYRYPCQSDSIQVAVTSLLNYLEERDSTIINFTGIGNTGASVWLNSKSDHMVRYWLKNELNDSVTVWIGSPSRNTIGLYLEQGISFRRPGRQENYSDARIDLQELDRSKLLEVRKIMIRSQDWKYHSEASFSLSQASMTNWVKGGESNISTTFDITGYANYTNKDLKLSSNNFARLKFGMIALMAAEKWDIRKNLDLLETNSKLNHKAFGKFDVSGILLFKTQIAPGYNYPNDSVQVSKFMNPGILTMGIGLDYKPNKNTSINFSPFSYKGTFVPDTARIDQTKYGIANDKRSKNEPGASFLISHEYKPWKTVSVINRLQLFTNYINNPLNIDVDWEMIVTANLNWFTDVRLNTHLIYDDDTKTPVLEKGIPVMGPDGKPKKAARIQFKELLGFSFVFRF